MHSRITGIHRKSKSSRDHALRVNDRSMYERVMKVSRTSCPWYNVKNYYSIEANPMLSIINFNDPGLMYWVRMLVLPAMPLFYSLVQPFVVIMSWFLPSGSLRLPSPFAESFVIRLPWHKQNRELLYLIYRAHTIEQPPPDLVICDNMRTHL